MFVDNATAVDAVADNKPAAFVLHAKLAVSQIFQITEELLSKRRFALPIKLRLAKRMDVVNNLYNTPIKIVFRVLFLDGFNL